MTGRTTRRSITTTFLTLTLAAGCGSSGPSRGGAAGAAATAGTSGGTAGGGASGGTTDGTAGAAAGASGGAAGATLPPPDDGGAAGGGAGADAATNDAFGASEGGVTITDPGTDGDGVFQIASPFKAAPEMSDQAGVAKGMIIQFTMANNTTFNDGARKVAVYVPANYVSGTEIPFMVAQDGVSPQNGGSFGLDDLRPLMDNMIAAKKIPMMAGVFADPGGMRSVEYDTVSDKYWQFVETELLPAAIAQAKMKDITLNLTKDPQGRGSFGGSSGGAAAFTMGWLHPESYTRILTISGSFTKLQSSTMYPNGAGQYAMTLIASSAVLPLRIFLEAGSMDLGNGRWRAANDAMSMALMMKGGYHYRYIQAAGAMHEDDGARRQYLPDAMQWLWRGYPIAQN